LDIDDFVAAWHRGRGAGTLRESLGFTEEEYALWVQRPDLLRAILVAHGLGLRISELPAMVEEIRSALKKKPALK
jgi:hypothetical protein